MMDFSQFNSPNLPINTLVTLTFYFILGAYAIFSAILYYHWKNFAADNKVSGLTLILYFTSTGPLLIAMGIIALNI